jgi:hypothetical protein
LLEEIRSLRNEVDETRKLKDQVTQHQNELYNLPNSGITAANRDFSSVVGGICPANGPPAVAAPRLAARP